MIKVAEGKQCVKCYLLKKMNCKIHPVSFTKVQKYNTVFRYTFTVKDATVKLK